MFGGENDSFPASQLFVYISFVWQSLTLNKQTDFSCISSRDALESDSRIRLRLLSRLRVGHMTGRSCWAPALNPAEVHVSPVKSFSHSAAHQQAEGFSFSPFPPLYSGLELSAEALMSPLVSLSPRTASVCFCGAGGIKDVSGASPLLSGLLFALL